MSLYASSLSIFLWFLFTISFSSCWSLSSYLVLFISFYICFLSLSLSIYASSLYLFKCMIILFLYHFLFVILSLYLFILLFPSLSLFVLTFHRNAREVEFVAGEKIPTAQRKWLKDAFKVIQSCDCFSRKSAPCPGSNFATNSSFHSKTNFSQLALALVGSR